MKITFCRIEATHPIHVALSSSSPLTVRLSELSYRFLYTHWPAAVPSVVRLWPPRRPPGGA